MPTRISKNSRRATHACLNCRCRKVRCDVSRSGSGQPCSNCRWDHVTCHVVPRAPARRLESIYNQESTSNSSKAHQGILVPEPSLRPDNHRSTASPEVSTYSGRSQAWCNILPAATWTLDESVEDSRELDECFEIPKSTLIADFFRGYFDHIHPMLPMLKESEVLPLMNLGNPEMRRDDLETERSLLLVQAILFASSTYVSSSVLDQLGFRNAKEARASFYKKAKTLYHNASAEEHLLLSQAALLLTHWCPAFSPLDKPNSTWLKIAIKHARSLQADRSWTLESVLPGSSEVTAKGHPLTDLKRLWWCCIIRDRIMSLCVRRPLQISQEDVEASKIVPLGREELFEAGSWDHTVWTHLFDITTLLCKLCLHVTIALTATHTEFDSEHMNDSTEYLLRVAVKDLQAWQDVAQLQLRSQKEDLASTSDRGRSMVLLHTNLLWIYNDSARLALYSHAMCLSAKSFISMRHGKSAPQVSDYLIIQTGFQKTVDHIVCCLDEILDSPTPNELPSSIVGCTALPLALHFCAMTARQRYVGSENIAAFNTRLLNGLKTLLRVIDICQPIYDGVHWISRTIQYFVECTHFDDKAQGVFDERLDEGEFLAEGTLVGDGSLSPILNRPSYYLRMALTIDISIREGRLPDEKDFPDSIRTLIYQTGCFMPLLFETESEITAEEESRRFMRSLALEERAQPPSASKDSLDWFIDQDRSLSFAMQMGLGP